MSRKWAKRIRDDTVELLRFERKLSDLAMTAYREYVPVVEAAVLPSLTASVTDPLPPDIDALVLTQEQWNAILDGTFMPGIEQLMAERVAALLEEADVDLEELQKAAAITALAPVAPVAPEVLGVVVGKVYGVPTVREWQSQYLADVRNRMVLTPDALFRDIARSIDEGMKGGEGIDGLRSRVQTFLDLGQTPDWTRRAETVARTEATGAFNGATLAANQAREVIFEQPLEKVWVSTIDSRTRKTHFAADGQRRPLNATFRVGKSDLRYPGDPRGRAEEVINCRCTTIELTPEESLPGEEDRQTERAETNSTVRNRVGQRVGDIQGEVDRRRDEEGVVRARDDDDGEGIVAAATNQEESMKRTWTGTLAPIGKPTGDGRIIKEDAKISFRDFPQPLQWQRVSSMGHDQSVVVGGITEASSDGKTITAKGFMLDTPEAAEVAELLAEGLVRPSVDPSDVVWEMVDEDGNAVSYEQLEQAWMAGEDIRVLDAFAEMTIMGATLVSHPAFAEAIITLDDVEDVDAEDIESVEEAADALVASIGISQRGTYYCDDTSVFADPEFSEPTGLHITDDGRIQGHLAHWGVCHIGQQERCITTPHSSNDYASFHVSEIGTPDGPLAVGRLTVGGGHAGPRVGVQGALEHYDNVCSTFAFVRAGEDEHGVWVSGIAAPGVSPEVLAEGLASPLSGDWRRIGGKLELVAALAVNTPGFPVPRGYRNDRGQEESLVAAAAVPPRTRTTSRSGEPMAAVIERAARLAAESAVESYVKRQRVEESVAQTAQRIRDRKLARANALADRLRDR